MAIRPTRTTVALTNYYYTIYDYCNALVIIPISYTTTIAIPTTVTMPPTLITAHTNNYKP